MVKITTKLNLHKERDFSKNYKKIKVRSTMVKTTKSKLH